MGLDAGQVDQVEVLWATAGHRLVEEWAREGLGDHRRVDPVALWVREGLAEEWGQVARAGPVDRRREVLEVLAVRWVPEGRAHVQAF